MEEYKGHTDWVRHITVWRGAVLSGGDKQIIQWTAFTVWSPLTHWMFRDAERGVIKTMMVMARKQQLGGAAVPSEVMHIIMHYYTAVNMHTGAATQQKKYKQ